MSSGVAVNDACKELYQQVKMNLKGKSKLNFAVFKISDNLKEIVPDDERPCKGDAPPEFTELVASLPQDDGRYIVYDYPYKGSSGGPASKVVFVMWCPGGASIKKKMLYASSVHALKQSLNDVGKSFHAGCLEDLCHKDMVEKLCKA